MTQSPEDPRTPQYPYGAALQPPSPAPKRRRNVIVLSIAGALIVVAGASAGIIAATSNPSAPHSVRCPGGYYAASGHCGSATPQDNTTTTPALSGTDEAFVTDMRSDFNFESTVDDSAIADFGEAVCVARQSSSSQATEIAFAQAQWSNMTAGKGDQMVRLAEQDICPFELPADTVTFVVTGSYADVTYGPSGSDSTGQVPMNLTQDIPSSPPLFYALSAQLQGGGQVSCEIQVDGVTMSSGTASGGYNIADCEISYINGGWVSDSSSG